VSPTPLEARELLLGRAQMVEAVKGAEDRLKPALDLYVVLVVVFEFY
jgi:hypothetical protein